MYKLNNEWIIEKKKKTYRIRSLVLLDVDTNGFTIST